MGGGLGGGGGDPGPGSAPQLPPRLLTCPWLSPAARRGLPEALARLSSWQVVRNKAEVAVPEGVKKSKNFIGLIRKKTRGDRRETVWLRGRRTLTMIQRLKCTGFIFQSAFS